MASYRVTVTIEVPDTMAPTIAAALDKVADEISDAGYRDNEWDSTRDDFNERRGGSKIKFRISQR